MGTLTYFLKELIFSLMLLSHGDTCWYHKVTLCNGDIMKTRSLATIYRVLLLLLVLPKRMAVIQVDTSNEICPSSTSKQPLPTIRNEVGI